MALTYKGLATVTVGAGGASNIEITSIPQTYTDLILKVSARTTRTDYNYSELVIQLNGITSTSNYSTDILLGNNGSAASFTISTYAQLNYISTNKTTSGIFGSTEIYIPNYISSNKKSIGIEGAAEVNGADNAMGLNSVLSENTGAITSIKIFPAANEGVIFTQYTSATLYGISKS
jgi:hypothetical protein